jgi:peptidoglycan/xylan/chitin deacetylase (PgdA/CDA1 family)
MIGIIANPSDYDVVAELFELFKTGWEVFRSGKQYDVVISHGWISLDEIDAKTVVLYGGRPLPHEVESSEVLASGGECKILRYHDLQLPIYGNAVVFPSRQQSLLNGAESGQPAFYSKNDDGRTVLRVGYDLFSEVRSLLTKGQPSAQASKPTLEIHIAVLRELLLLHGAPLVEVPPVPGGYKFIACLTHDMDHPSLRAHKFDHTVFGFVYRAIFGSVANLMTCRGTLRQLLRNWWAAVKLPSVHSGVVRDFWLDFTRYIELEAGHPSTFYLIPFKGERGHLGTRLAPKRRAAGYDVGALEIEWRNLRAANCEIALHGIDAWNDATHARAESERIKQITGGASRGVRMHWLYFDDTSPATLESAGFNYDSSVGFNNAVGFRAGTTQVYKPLTCSHLLELPLHIMDTALFYPTYLNLRPNQAMDQVRAIIANAVRFGGCVTINWHDRSISPERCWDGFYKELIRELEENGAWFATAEEVVSWFRKRRAVTFETKSSVTEDGSGSLQPDSLPALQCRVHIADETSRLAAHVS